MKIDQLESLTSDPYFHRIPRQLADAELGDSGKWQDFQEVLVKYETQLAIWTAGQHALALFDQYANLETLEVWVTSTSKGAIQTDVYINGKSVSQNGVFISFGSDELADTTVNVDGGGTLRTSSAAISGLAAPHHVYDLTMYERAFESTFTSTDQVRTMIETFAGPVRAHIDRWRLSAHVVPTSVPPHRKGPGL